MHQSDERCVVGVVGVVGVGVVGGLGDAKARQAEAGLEAAVTQTFSRKSFFNHFNTTIEIRRH